MARKAARRIISGSAVRQFGALQGTPKPPVNTTPPAITGTLQVGQVLSASAGVWANTPTTITRQWLRANESITGATGATYTLVTADVGNQISVQERATNSQGYTTSRGALTPPVPASVGGVAAPVSTAIPTISGAAQVGQTLTASPGSWSNSPNSYAYQWYRGSTPIGGATVSTYVPVQSDVGNSLSVTVTATNSGGSSSATSAATSAVIAIAATGASPGTVSSDFSDPNTIFPRV